MQASVEEGSGEVNDYRLNNVWHSANFGPPFDVSQSSMAMTDTHLKNDNRLSENALAERNAVLMVWWSVTYTSNRARTE